MTSSSAPRLLTTALALAALALAGAMATTARADYRDRTNPFRGQRLFMDCEPGHTGARIANLYSAWWHVYHPTRGNRWSRGKRSDVPLLKKLARVPTVKWFAAQDNIHNMTRQVERFLTNVDHPRWGGVNCSRRLHYSALSWETGPVPARRRNRYVGSYPVIAIRQMKHQPCRHGTGGSWNSTSPHGKYKRWINAFVWQLGRTYDAPDPYEFWFGHAPPWTHWRSYRQRRASVILEPDALGLLGHRSNCLTRAARKRRYALLRYAVNRLRRLPNVKVYIDAGAGDWLTVHEAVYLLRRSGVAHARGFALNATHFDRTRNEVRFGNRVARILHRHFIVNTAENAHGQLPRRMWPRGVKGRDATTCNPRNAGLGHQPTSHTGSRWADAFLYIGRPGLSGNGRNRCKHGPTSATWYRDQAIRLARQASFRHTNWPSRPM